MHTPINRWSSAGLSREGRRVGRVSVIASTINPGARPLLRSERVRSTQESAAWLDASGSWVRIPLQ